MAVRFGKLADVRARPDFDPAFVVTLENYRSVVGPTQFPDTDKGSCQLHRDGRLCQVEFQNGWLVRAANDAGDIEALVGKDCAHKYFKDFVQFHADTARADRELELRNLQERRDAILSDSTYVPGLNRCKYRLDTYERTLSELRQRIPAVVVSRLTAMGRGGGGRITLEASYRDEDSKGNEFTAWEKIFGEEISGVTLWSQKSASVHGALSAIRTAYEGAASAIDEALPKLGRRVRNMEQVPSLVQKIEALEAQLRAFSSPENLGRVCLLTRSPLEQTIIAELALERAGKPHQPKDVQSLLDGLHADLQRQFGGRQVRVSDD